MARVGRGAPAQPAPAMVAQAPAPTPVQTYVPADPVQPASFSPGPSVASLANHPPGGYYVQTAPSRR